MTRPNISIFILVIATFTSSGAAQSSGAVEELKVCARMTDQNARLACFDKLGARVLREESAENEPTREEKSQPEAATETTAIVEPLPDDLGSSKTIQYLGLITSCKRGQYGDWYFIFDNGQVWKEVNGRNLRFKECNFHATIMKDAFGYKMRIEGEQRTIRVRRNR